MFQIEMKKSPVHPKCDLGDCIGYVFDPLVDFPQFLEEARQHAREEHFKVNSCHREEAKKQKLGEEKKNKKSWKNSLISWLKSDKKGKTYEEPASGSHISNAKKGHVSGPIHGSGRGLEGRHRRPTSGPLSSLFIPVKRMENNVPYMNLDKLDSPHGIQAYGPVYMVT